MEYVKHYRCTLCGTIHNKDEYVLTCEKCKEKGILDTIYDYEKLRKVMNRKYLKDNPDLSIWRYGPLMSVKETDCTKTLHVGMTPLYKSVRLGASLGFESLWIKDDGVNPSGSMKDRASLVACMKALETGYDTISCASTGNAASSLAAHAARLGLKAVIFVPERVPKGKLTQLHAYGATIIKVKGDYKEAFSLSKKAIEHYGWYNRNAAINPNMVEGKKTIAFEIAEQRGFNVPDWVVISVGDGCSIGALYNGFYDLYSIGMTDRIPRLLGVQSEGCAPLYQAFKDGRPLREWDEDTLADSIAVSRPRNPVKALRAAQASRGDYVVVSDRDILSASERLGKTEGVFAEPASAASLAGAVEALRQGIIKCDESVVIINTGNGLKDTDALKARIEAIPTLNNDLDALKDLMHCKGGTHE